MYVKDMSVEEAKEWLRNAKEERLTADDVQDLEDLIAGRCYQN